MPRRSGAWGYLDVKRISLLCPTLLLALPAAADGVYEITSGEETGSAVFFICMAPGDVPADYAGRVVAPYPGSAGSAALDVKTSGVTVLTGGACLGHFGGDPDLVIRRK